MLGAEDVTAWDPAALATILYALLAFGRTLFKVALLLVPRRPVPLATVPLAAALPGATAAQATRTTWDGVFTTEGRLTRVRSISSETPEAAGMRVSIALATRSGSVDEAGQPE